MAGDLTLGLDDVAALDGFFGLATGPAERADPSWRPFREFTGEILDQHIRTAAAAPSRLDHAPVDQPGQRGADGHTGNPEGGGQFPFHRQAGTR